MTLKNFKKSKKNGGVKYAVCWLLNLPFLFSESKIRFLRRFSDQCYDYCYNIDYEKSLKEYFEDKEDFEAMMENKEATPCGCTFFDCEECGSYHACY